MMNIGLIERVFRHLNWLGVIVTIGFRKSSMHGKLRTRTIIDFVNVS